MRDLLEKMGKHGVRFAVGLMLSQVVGFVLMPFLTRSVPRADYGTLDVLTNCARLMLLVAAMGVPSALYRAYAYSATNDPEKRRAIASGFRFVLASSALVTLVFGALAAPISVALVGTPHFAVLFVLILLTYLFGNLKNACAQVLRADYRSQQFLLVYCGEFVLCAALNLWFVVGWKLGIAGIVYSNLIGAAAALLLAVAFVPHSIAPEAEGKQVKAMLRFGLPLVPQAIAAFLLDTLDRYLFLWLLGEHGKEVNGMYGRAYSVAGILNGVLLMPFMTLWPNLYYDLSRRPTAAQDLGRCASYYFAVGCFLAVGLSMVSEPLVQLMTDVQYHEAWRAVPILAFSLVFFGFADVTKVGMMVAGRTHWMPFLVIAALLINGLVNLGLIPKLELTGAAWSSLIAYASLALLAGLVSRRLLTVRYEWARLIKVAVACAVLLAISSAWPLATNLGKLDRILAILQRGTVAAIGFPLLLWIMGFLTARERELAGKALRRWTRRGA